MPASRDGSGTVSEVLGGGERDSVTVGWLVLQTKIPTSRAKSAREMGTRRRNNFKSGNHEGHEGSRRETSLRWDGRGRLSPHRYGHCSHMSGPAASFTIENSTFCREDNYASMV